MKTETMTVSEFAHIINADPHTISRSARDHPENYDTLKHIFAGNRMLISRRGAYAWLGWTDEEIREYEQSIEKG